MNWIGLTTIIAKELNRTKQVFLQAVLSPLLTTVLYFVVFGGAIGSRIPDVGGASYAQFIVPGMIAMAVVMNAILAASSGIYFPRFIGTITDLLSAPMSFAEIVFGFAIASAIRTIGIAFLIYIVALFFVPLPIAHPIFTILFVIFASLGFSFLGLVLGIWAKDFEQLSFVPSIVITPLSFLGGIFYSIDMLPPLWKTLTLLNPIFYFVDTLRYAMLGIAPVHFLSGPIFLAALLAVSLLLLHRILTTGYRIRN